MGRDQHGATFVAGRDEFEQHAGFRLVLLHVGQVIQDQEMIAVEFRQLVFQRQFPARAQLSRCTKSVVRVNSTR